MLSRPVPISAGSIVPTIIGVVGGVALMVAGLVAEYMCTVPPEDDKRGDGGGAQQRI